MKVARAADMRAIDQRAQKESGISADSLMTEAGRAVAREAVARFSPSRVCIVCGKGNNAGDGFVAARDLAAGSIQTNVICLLPRSELKGPAANAYDRMIKSGIAPLPPTQLLQSLRDSDLVIDALLGTGVQGIVKGGFAHAIESINQAQAPTLAVDIPSGIRELEADEELGPAVRAGATVTIGLPKLALLQFPGIEYAGKLIVAPINFPRRLLEDKSLLLNLAAPAELAAWIPHRPADSNKGMFGRTGIIAGSGQYAGAAILLARGALRAGCGLAYIFTTAALNPIFKTALPEAVTHIVDSANDNSLDARSMPEILQASQKFDVLAMGPGLGTTFGQAELILGIADKWKGPLVLDADALTCLAVTAPLMPRFGPLRSRSNRVLTPHPGEMARLTGLSIDEIQSDRVSAAANFARRHGVNLLLKGASTVIARPSGQTYINPGGTSALAKGGTGDVLTGAIAGLISQGLEPWKAAVLAAHLHLAAGRNCAARTGEWGVFASEVADEIPHVMKEISSC